MFFIDFLLWTTGVFMYKNDLILCIFSNNQHESNAQFLSVPPGESFKRDSNPGGRRFVGAFINHDKCVLRIEV